MKNLLLFSTLLLTTAGAFAQLSVKPNGTTDSYVYVKDQVLYVANEINLTRNTNGPSTTEASIYLRENGQLIQGGTTSNNSGNGQLSVQQNTPETNNWAYYYWCSPVGYPGTLATPQPAGNPWAGIVNVYEPLPLTSVTAARLAAITPYKDGSPTPMTISTRWLYTHKFPGTEAEADYQRINANTAVPPGYGFTMKGVGWAVPGINVTYDFRGRPNSGTFTIPVDTGLMTLAGNPYPSALDLNKLFYDLPDNAALGTFRYYDEDRTVASHYYSQKPYGYGVYTVGTEDTDNIPNNIPPGTLGVYAEAPFYYYNSGGGNGTQVGTGGTDQNKRFAPIGQGIMFVGDANGPVKIKNSYRVFFKEDTAGSVFQRPDGNTTPDEGNNAGGPTLSTSAETTTNVDNRTPQTRIWAIFDEAVTRDMVIAFYDQATDGYDRGLDGLSAQDLKTDAYFPIGNDNDRKPYVINGTNYSLDKQIPIAFKVKNNAQIRLVVVEEVKKPYQHAYLFDSQENTYKELNNATASGVILTLPAGTYDNRFFIVFRNPNIKRDTPQTELEAKDAVLANVNVFQNNPVQQMEVSNPEGYTINSAMVYDMNGKLVIQEKNLGSKNKYSFYTGNLSDGVYLVKLTTSEDFILDYKVIVHNK
ncbi:T9SS type A sorting domain-containing protein [Aequorivita todarodis]|uniref:T9SS type A sorting domain-containing protein n=1 Tax=Aequorivita todarodis TaxID=2036821 RepID=UPI00234FEAB5|nr:T9SS type A sorting domain-containing protein [Aequorivita todarodis]MDC7999781.1 T9SS type A sorting domain-containing protein [Aequorivita todarodis]